MAKKGQNLRLFIGGKCVAASTSCSFHVAAQTEDVSTKDSTGDWQENEATGKSWDCSADALVLLTDDGGETAVSMIGLVGQTVQLVFDETDGDKNRTAKNSVIKHSGSAIVADYSLTAGNRQNATYSVQFTGTGALS